MPGFGDELKSRLPEIALAILAAKTGGPQALGAFQGGVNQARQRQQQFDVQQQALARQAQMDDERRQQQQIENERASDTARRADEAAQQQRLTQALSAFDRYSTGVSETALDPVAAEGQIFNRGAQLEGAYGLPQGQLSAFVPSLTQSISTRKAAAIKRLAKAKLEEIGASKLYKPEDVISGNTRFTSQELATLLGADPQGGFSGPELMKFAELDARTSGGQVVPPTVATPTSLVPNTPEEQFYQQYAAENGAKTFGELPTAKQAGARKQWMQADDRPPIQVTVGGSGLTPQQITAASGLRDDYRTESRDFYAARDGYERVLASAKDPSAAGDLALLYGYMKLLDPNSVVRETEFAQAAKAGSLPQQIQAQALRLVNGQRLTPEQRNDFLSRAQALFGKSQARQTDRGNKYKSIAKQSGVPAELVVQDEAPVDESVIAPPAGRQPVPNPFRR